MFLSGDSQEHREHLDVVIRQPNIVVCYCIGLEGIHIPRVMPDIFFLFLIITVHINLKPYNNPSRLNLLFFTNLYALRGARQIC